MTPRRKQPLRRSLLVLVLVPVTGLAAVVGVGLENRVQESRSAQQAVDDVHQAIALDAVRGDVAAELLPALGTAVLSDPSILAGSQVDPTFLGSVDVTALTTSSDTAQDHTDEAVASAGSAPSGLDVSSIRKQLAQARKTAAGLDVDATFEAYQAILTSLEDGVNAQLRHARAQGLNGASSTALSNLQRVSRATSLGSSAFPLYLRSVAEPRLIPDSLAPDRTTDWFADTAQGRFVKAWAGYREAASEVAAVTAPHLVAAWTAASATADATQVDQMLTAAALTEAVPTLSQLNDLSLANTRWDADQRTVLAEAASTVLTTTEAQADGARRDLEALVGLVFIVVGATAVTTVSVRRSIAKPLARLAVQAEAVGRGDLVDIELAGPDEVRTLAEGLTVAVESLRRVRAQAQAVASGDLDADVLRTPAPGALGATMHDSLLKMMEGIQERQRLQDDLAYQAGHDALTELPNRSQIVDLIGQALHRAVRTSSCIGVLYLDLDHFKSVNDTHGRVVGDEVLQTVAARLKETVRGGDVVGRLGGDEFAVLVELVDDEKGLLDLGQRLIQAVSAPVEVGGSTVRVGVSVGVTASMPTGATTSATTSATSSVPVSVTTTVPVSVTAETGRKGLLASDAGVGNRGDAERLLADATAAGYRAKDAGRGVVEVFDEGLRWELAARAQMEVALRHALDDDELVLHYQPVVDLASGRTRSVEALVRWERPGHGLVPPNAFIPTAEASSLICDLGCWALLEATRQLARWDAEGGDRAGLRVAVNISGRHLAMPHLLEDVTGALAASGIDPGRLTVEITETVLVDEPLAMQHLQMLRELGVRIAIDDFGTGYTSIGQLSRLPVDVLKIDRSFVASQERGHAELVQLLISAAHSLSLSVVAEGVEEDAQLAPLLTANCDSVQGFLFARPVPPEHLPVATRSLPQYAHGSH